MHEQLRLWPPDETGVQKGRLRLVDGMPLTVTEAEHVHICWERVAEWKLSAGRQAVLICIVRGMANKEIASELGRSLRVVRQDVERIYRAAGIDGLTASARAELVTRAMMPADHSLRRVI